MSREEPNDQPNELDSRKKNIIIIKKIKKHHDGHHGGAWKVAYADFVTAMMAFFLLMWLINTVTTDQLKGVAQYFMPESGLRGMRGWGFGGESNSKPLTRTLHLNQSTESLYPGTPTEPQDHNKEKEMVVDSDATKLVSVMNNLAQSMDGTGEVSQMSDNVIIDKTPEGIRIQIIDSLNRSVFKSGSTEIQPYMNKFLYVIGDLIKSVPNYIAIEGHTSEEADPGIKGKDQWTLSLERADIIRKFYQQRIKKDQILKVTGRANTEPYDLKEPKSLKNSRIVIILLNMSSVGKIQSAIPEEQH
ncbi:MAG: flagellar motor protein MotB [Rickettsiaceae bacterium]|nr:flagellar motor protein MotB [Rickettsiaceae bacterium]